MGNYLLFFFKNASTNKIRKTWVYVFQKISSPITNLEMLEWYYISAWINKPLVFSFQNCSDLPWEKKSQRSLSRTLLETESFFLTCSWRFLRSNTLEQFKLKKTIGIKKPTRQFRKSIFFPLMVWFQVHLSNFQSKWFDLFFPA